MPWITPTLKQVRTMVRDDITSALSGAVLIGNNVLRVMSDANAGLAHLNLRFIDWLARQLLPDTAEIEWLDRHGDIWLVNADGSLGRKSATLAFGTVTLTGINGTVVPSGTQLTGIDVDYETIEQITIGLAETNVAVRALTGGANGNLDEGDTISLTNAPPDVDSKATVVTMEGGADEETDDLLRARILFRIRNPPMGGDAADYVAWTMAIPGVTRAWSYPNGMGIGTIVVRFMMDDLRSSNNGYPLALDVDNVRAYLDQKRPVAVKDSFAEAPLPYVYNITITNLDDDTAAVRARIEAEIRDMEYRRLSPGQTLYRSWVDEAISAAVGEDSHELNFVSLVMPGEGYMARLGVVTYA